MANPPQETSAEQSTEPDLLQEGQAKIIVDKKNVFYNPVQEFNRDLSIAVLTQYSKEWSQNNIDKPNPKQEDSPKGLRVLEALSATGLRSIRYAKEVPGIDKIVANDISTKAVEAIKRNVDYNELSDIIEPHNDDATMIMYQNRKERFDVVDLDPYGCPTTFLDGAVQCLKNNGLLLVTATDMAVLAGNSPETCYVKYGAVSLKSKVCHEMALRILLQNIASHAARYGRVITPILSVSADFYIRVFLKIHTSQAACKGNTSKLGLVYQCTGCESMTIQPLGTMNDKKVHKLPQVPAVNKECAFCKHKHHMGGPIWTGPLHDKDFIMNILTDIESEETNNLKSLGTLRRIHGILHVVHEEIETPLYYQLDRLVSIIKCSVPPMLKFRSAILNAGYRISYSHAHKNSIKTNAPNEILWDIIKAWEKESPVNKEKFAANSPGLAILNSPSSIEVSFLKHTDAVPFSQRKKMTRFQVNPTAHWGPGTRSTTIIQDQRALSKSERNQNKKRKREQVNAEKDNEEKKQNVDEGGDG